MSRVGALASGIATVLLSRDESEGLGSDRQRLVNLGQNREGVLRAAYSASKFAIDGMTLALAAEHSSDGIIANSIAPGFVDTEMTRRILGEAGTSALVAKVPAARLGRTEEIARLVLWLASDENTYLAGQNIAIDGAFSRV